ncbi:DNA-processing protein DprA [candidate division KSB1 bacterium]
MDISGLLYLTAIPKLGANRIIKLINAFKTPENILKARVDEISMVPGFDKKIAELIVKNRNKKFVENQLKILNLIGAKIISLWDKEYPENLKNIFDPPILLFVRGEFKENDKFSISIVGSRSPSIYGKLDAEKISAELTKEGLTIVSGFARGIDSAAHKSVLDSGGRTIAVLGCGVNIIYPPEQRRLFFRIIDNGAVISEYPFDTPPDPYNFPRRNRIISGLSLGTLVVEAGEKSGALITANQALEQNREVYAMPRNISFPTSKGTNELIKSGAKLVQSGSDILEEIAPHIKKKNIEEKVLPALTDDEKKVYGILSEEPIHVDKISELAGKKTSEIPMILLNLELKGIIKQVPGAKFMRI